MRRSNLGQQSAEATVKGAAGETRTVKKKSRLSQWGMRLSAIELFFVIIVIIPFFDYERGKAKVGTLSYRS